MSGGEIKNVLTLDVSKFDSAVKKATQSLDKLDSRLEQAGKIADKLDKTVNALSDGLGGVSGGFQILNRVVGNVSAKLDSTASSMDKVSKSSKKARGNLKGLVDSAEKLETMDQWVAHYGKALDKLNPIIGKTLKSHAELDKAFLAQRKNAKATAEDVARARVKALAEERKLIRDQIAERRKMVEQLAKIEDRANVTIGLNNSRARYLRKDNPERIGLDQTTATARAEAAAASEQRKHLQSIINELEWRNRKLREGVISSMQEVRAQRELAAEEQRRLNLSRQMEAQRKAQADAAERERKAWKKHFDDLDRIGNDPKTQAKVAQIMRERSIVPLNRNDQAKFYENLWGENGSEARAQRKAQEALERQQRQAELAAKRKADAELRELQRVERERERMAKAEEKRLRDAEKERIRAAKAAAAAEKQAARETAEMWKSIGTMYTGVQSARGVRAGTQSISEYELASKRIDFFNLPTAENEEFKAKAAQLSQENPMISQKDSLLLRGDAMSALGYNNVKIIDSLMPIASKAATLLQTMGYDNNELSTIMKNMWGVIEMLGQQYDTTEAKKTIETLFQAAVVSQGKVTIQDIETFLRNAGAAGRSITTEGVAGVVPLLEMFKTAGGGSGGGSGVARVGTMIKMISAYANGKSLKNEAVDQLLGAGVLNAEFDSMTVEQFRAVEKKNIEMMRQLKIAGMKDGDLLVENPVEFVKKLRGPLLEFMMRPENFARYFSGRERFSYNDKNQMVDANGKIVGMKDQDRIEAGAFGKFFNGMGVSQNTIDGMVTLMQYSSLVRGEHINEQMKQAMDVEKAFAAMMDTWAANTNKLKVAAMDLAVAFEPVLDTAGEFVSWSADVLNSITNVINGENGMAKFVTVFGLVAGAAAVAMSPLRVLTTLFKRLGNFKKGGDAAADTIKKIGDASKGASSHAGKLFGAGLLANADKFFGVIRGGPALLGALRLGLGALGGPFGILASALITGAALWADWGNKAQSALAKANKGFANVQSLAERVKQNPEEAIGQLPYLDKEYQQQLEAYKEARARDDQVGLPSNQMSEKSKQILRRLNEIDRLRTIAREQEAKKKEETGKVGKSDDVRVVETPASGPGRSGGGNRKERNFQDAFQISLEQLKGDAELARIERAGLIGDTASYEERARAAFQKAWMTGKFDDGKDPSNRKFTTGKFDKEKGWTEKDIDWNAKGVSDWMKAWVDKQANQDGLDAVRFAQGNAASSAQEVADAFQSLVKQTDAQSDALTALTKKFARYEGQRPAALSDPEYVSAKNATITNQIVKDALDLASKFKSADEGKMLDFSGMSDYRKQILLAEQAREKEERLMEARLSALQQEIANYAARNNLTQEEQRAFESAKSALEQMTPIYEQHKQILVQAVQEAKKTAVQKTFDQWSKIEDQYNSLATGWLNNVADALSGVLVGEDQIDLRGFMHTVTKDLSGMFLRAAMSELNNILFGSTSFFEQVMAVFKGQMLGEDTGIVGGFINRMIGNTGQPGEVAPGMIGYVGQVLSGETPEGDSGFLDSFKVAMTDLGEKVKGLGVDFSSLGTTLQTGFTGALDWVTTSLGSLGSGLLDGVSSLGEFSWTLITDAISALWTWVSSLLAASAATEASSSGGFMGALGSMFSFAANGAYFDSGVAEFAKGGTFTNGLYNSPTPFKFAKGGSFNLGVMGEAGPEAVMPLSRDSSGRLGVTVQGMDSLARDGNGGGDTNVVITINVTKEGGSTEQSTGQENDQWRNIANRVKGLVVQEIVNQKRPGGALYA